MSFRTKIIQCLSQNSVNLNLEAVQGRQWFLDDAGIDLSIQRMLHLDGPVINFCTMLVNALLAYGIQDDGSDPIASVLRTARKRMGYEDQTRCDELLKELQTFRRTASP